MEINIKDFQLSVYVGHRIQKTVDSGTAHFITLSQGTEANGARTQCQTFQFIRKGMLSHATPSLIS